MEPKATRYAVSKQGNRNLLLNADDIEWFDSLPSAREHAWRCAGRDHRNWYVHEVAISSLFVYRTPPALEEEIR